MEKNRSRLVAEHTFAFFCCFRFDVAFLQRNTNFLTSPVESSFFRSVIVVKNMEILREVTATPGRKWRFLHTFFMLCFLSAWVLCFIIVFGGRALPAPWKAPVGYLKSAQKWPQFGAFFCIFWGDVLSAPRWTWKVLIDSIKKHRLFHQPRGKKSPCSDFLCFLMLNLG